jgi:deazaflavin-dependent oxidoreductase (nitroreductase family)
MSGRRSDPSGFNASVINEFRANGGIVGGELSDVRLLLLTTIDERSRTPRTTPLAYHRRGSRYLVIASNGGATRNPVWFRNLARDRGVTVEVGAETSAATARILAAWSVTPPSPRSSQRRPARAFETKAGRTIPVIELGADRTQHPGRKLLGGTTRAAAAPARFLPSEEGSALAADESARQSARGCPLRRPPRTPPRHSGLPASRRLRSTASRAPPSSPTFGGQRASREHQMPTRADEFLAAVGMEVGFSEAAFVAVERRQPVGGRPRAEVEPALMSRK